MFKKKNLKKDAAVLLTALALIAAVPVVGQSVKADALSSSVVQDVGKAYFASDYRYLSDEDSVFETVTYEEAVYLFGQEGTYLFLLGGSWCPNTTAIIDYVNAAAQKAGVERIYNLDFRLDGSDANSHIRESDGSSADGARYNYLYGELVTRYLTNLDDWVEYTSDRATALTYTNTEGEEVTVAKVQVPFLFLYNKDNTVRNYEDINDNRTVKTGRAEQGKTYPIVYGFERMIYRKSGTSELYTSSGTQDESTQVSDYPEQLESAIFSHVGRGEGRLELTSTADADYIRLSYNQKAGETLFAEDGEINIRTLTYKQLKWLLGQEGQYLLLFGGSWNADTRAIIKKVNEYAVENGLIVYNFDFKLDGGYAKINWNYSRDLNISQEDNEFANLYASILADLSTDEIPQLLLYDKNGQTPVVADADNESGVSDVFQAYAQKTGAANGDSEGNNSYISRIVAAAIGVAVIAGALVYGYLKKDKVSAKAQNSESVQTFDENDGCGGCEAELPEQTEQKQESISSFDDLDGGCGGFDDDDEGGCC